MKCESLSLEISKNTWEHWFYKKICKWHMRFYILFALCFDISLLNYFMTKIVGIHLIFIKLWTFHFLYVWFFRQGASLFVGIQIQISPNWLLTFANRPHGCISLFITRKWWRNEKKVKKITLVSSKNKSQCK